jgi:hypothetical protein
LLDQGGQAGVEIGDLGGEFVPAAGQTAHACISLVSLRPASCSRSCAGAVTSRACSSFMQAVRDMTGPARTMCRARIDSVIPIAGLGYRGSAAGQHGIGGGVGIQWVGLAFESALPPVRPIDFDNFHAIAGQVAG